MKKILLTLLLIAGVFIVTQAQTRGANHPRKFKQERPRHRPHNRVRKLDRRQRAELRRVHRRHKMRKQSRTVMLQEQFNLYAENSKQAA
jgi:Ni/Co efflux regulator RcnB